jgi:protein involved in polysaccharide export with SLBB domain
MAALLLALGGCAPGDPGFGAIFAEDVSYYGAPQGGAYPAPIVAQAGWGETTVYAEGGQVSPEPMGWGSKTFVMPAPPMGIPMAMPGPNSPYILGTGDKLRVFVYGQPSLSRLYTVSQAGEIAVPLIGSVRARGRTTDQLEHTIRARLARDFVRDPQVTVDVAQNRPFFILGEVRLPGQYPFVSGMTVETAVAISGGYTPRASERRFRITRRLNNGLVDQIEAPSDYTLLPGDTVYVFERFL